MVQATIRKLIHLSSGTDVPATHLVPGANGVGYGYIESVDGDVFFDYAAVKNRRFDELKMGMTVEYVLDLAPYLRSSDVTVVSDGACVPQETMPAA